METPDKKLKGKLIEKITKETSLESNLRGKLLDKKEGVIEFDPKVGDIIAVKKLRVQTPVAPMEYTGNLEVMRIDLKGSLSPLKVKGLESKSPEDDYCVFRIPSGGTCTASFSSIEKCLER